MIKKKTVKSVKNKALSKPDVYKEFILWMSIPGPLRNLKTQGEFARKFTVRQATLSDWKQKNDFWEAVEGERNRWGKEKTSNVLASFYQRVMKKGRATDYKLWFQYFLGWNEKAKAEHTGELKIIHEYADEKLRKDRIPATE